ncbi:protein of unknown function [Paenibacillus alvei]|uniref:Uncharacterized protein n=1 Tax=Paenibacillus alvei TaxID=44250 RepID=A0A383RM61_PAEAL|nr:protein of unknown function [Paenibacillus alvei]
MNTIPVMVMRNKMNADRYLAANIDVGIGKMKLGRYTKGHPECLHDHPQRPFSAYDGRFRGT